MDINKAKKNFKAIKMVAIVHKKPLLMASALYGEIKLITSCSANYVYSASDLESFLQEETQKLQTEYLWEDEHIGDLYMYWYNFLWYYYHTEELNYSNEDIVNAEIYTGELYLKDK